MNRPNAFLLLGTSLSLAALPLSGQTSVELVGLEGRGRQEPTVPAVFGGSEQKLDLNVSGVPDRSGTALYADLFQIAGTLARPIATHVQLNESFSLTPTAPDGEQVSLNFPEVKRQTEILVRLSALKRTAPPNGGQSADSVAVGELHFMVFPPSLTQEVKDLLEVPQDKPARAFLFGPGQKLRTFFKNASIRFEDGGASTPDRLNPGRYYFLEAADQNQVQTVTDRRAGCCLAVFYPDAELPAGLYSEQSQGGTFVRVTSPLLNDLNVDPRAQLALLKIIHLLASPLSNPSNP